MVRQPNNNKVMINLTHQKTTANGLAQSLDVELGDKLLKALTGKIESASAPNFSHIEFAW
jgi:hypothetical protein